MMCLHRHTKSYMLMPTEARPVPMVCPQIPLHAIASQHAFFPKQQAHGLKERGQPGTITTLSPLRALWKLV